jgi:membrane protein YqaA with SNARE-associated domain
MNPYLAPASPGPYDAPALAAYSAGPQDRGAQVSDLAVEALRQTRPWVVFLSVMSFIGCGFMLLAGVGMMVVGAFTPSSSPVPTAVLGLIYIPMAFLYIYPALKLWAFGGAITRLTASRSSADLEAALSQQKSFWKFLGIVTIVLMALYGVAIVGMMVVGFAAASRGH